MKKKDDWWYDYDNYEEKSKKPKATNTLSTILKTVIIGGAVIGTIYLIVKVLTIPSLKKIVREKNKKALKCKIQSIIENNDYNVVSVGLYDESNSYIEQLKIKAEDYDKTNIKEGMTLAI